MYLKSFLLDNREKKILKFKTHMKQWFPTLKLPYTMYLKSFLVNNREKKILKFITHMKPHL